MQRKYSNILLMRRTPNTEHTTSVVNTCSSFFLNCEYTNCFLKPSHRVGSFLKSVAGCVVAVILFCSPVYAEVINLSIIQHIESHGNPLAYNTHSKARGLYQITPICLADYNQFHTSKIKQSELFNPSKNELVAKWYFDVRISQLLKHFKQTLTLENYLIAYNAGIKSVISKRIPRETADYIKKYKRNQRGG